MRSWSSAQKIMVIIPTVLIGMVGFYGYWNWQSLPERALIPGRSQTLDHTVGTIIRSRARPYKYLVFSREEISTALADADLHFRGATRVADHHLSADSGHVTWRNGRADNHSVPGLFIRVEATLQPVEGSAAAADTLMLRLPGLSTLAARDGDDVLISYNGNTPRDGDSVMMQRYRSYPTAEAVERARVPYLVLTLLMAAIVLLIAARVAILSIE